MKGQYVAAQMDRRIYSEVERVIGCTTVDDRVGGRDRDFAACIPYLEKSAESRHISEVQMICSCPLRGQRRARRGKKSGRVAGHRSRRVQFGVKNVYGAVFENGL